MTNELTAIVTGAGSGIGQSVAQELSKAGYRLVLAGRDESKLRATALALARTAEDVAIFPTDIADPSACRKLVQEAVRVFGRVDALANVAGFASLTPIPRITDSQWLQTIDVNLSSVVHLTTAAWPHLRVRGGVIANVSSMASVDPFPNFAMYAAAKAAVNMFTRCTASEGAPLRIKAVSIAPGAVETPMLRSMFNEKMIPPASALSPVQVARVIVDCITGKRAFTSGETILVPSP